MYQLSTSCYAAINNYMTSHIPFEACGIIAAHSHTPTHMEYFFPIKNIHPNKAHYFSYNPQDWINVIYTIQKQNLVLVSYVHSHIAGECTLSADDLQAITDYDALQVIMHYTEKDSFTMYVYRYNELTHIYERCLLTFT